ncbi:hypothetical protein KKA66_03345 [Patescibacteria group bacterium]|nr:hypothetical protein [Patescibacteria group bacterium]
MKSIITEEDIELAALEMFREQGYEIVNGLDIAPDGKNPERESYQDIILVDRLRRALEKINNVPKEAIEQAIKHVLRTSTDKLIVNNHAFHDMLINGVNVEYRKDGTIKHDKVWLLGKDNEFLAVNQYTIIENNINRRPDILLFINGIPIVIIELKKSRII